jgi:hypothetical protein
MAHDPATPQSRPQGPASDDPERLRRLYRIITGAEPICPACGEPLGSLIAKREAGARQDAYMHALRIVRAAMTHNWSMAQLAEVLQACEEATIATRS